MAYVDNLRRNFPAVRNTVYLNTGTYGALPDICVQTMTEVWQEQLLMGRQGDAHYQLIADVKQSIRRELGVLFHANENDFALMDSTTHAFNALLWGLSLQAGDEIIVIDNEHAEVLVPLGIQKQRRGIVIRTIPGGLDGALTLSALQQQISPRTRVVIASHVSWSSGHRLPIEDMATIAHSSGALMAVDGAQGAGAQLLALGETTIDFYALPGQKWLCGPDGTGALYVRPCIQSMLDSTYGGYATLSAGNSYEAFGSFQGAPTIRRLEHSNTSYATWKGWLASLQFLRVTAGFDYVVERIRGVSGQLFERLLDINHIEMITPRDARVGLLHFRVKGQNSVEIVKQAAERGIDIKALPRFNCIRVSTGFYNSEEDLDRVSHFFESVVSTRT